MEGQKIYRHCPSHHNSPCYNSTCEHQCFMDEQECRKPEPEHHKECPITTLPCVKKCDTHWCKMSRPLGFPHDEWKADWQPKTVIHIHNDFGPLLESFLSIHQKLDKIMSTQAELAAQVQAIGTSYRYTGSKNWGGIKNHIEESH